MNLIQKGLEVHVIYLFDLPNVLPYNLKFISLKADAGKRFWDFTAYKKLNDIIRKENYDIVQANAGDTLKYSVLSKLLYRWQTPLIFRNANKVSDFIDTKLKYLINKFFISHLQYVISVSELCKHDFIKTFSFGSHSIETVPIGIDLVQIGNLPIDLADLYSRGPVLINVASMVPEKNHHGLLSIFAKLLKFVPDAQLILVGKGKLESRLKERVVGLGIHRSVHFIGYRKDVLEIMRASQMLLLPSHIEGLPAVLLEAQYSKTPVIAYDVGGIGEVVKNDQTGWLIQKDNEGKFVQAILKVLQEDKDEVNKIIARAFYHVTEEFDNQLIADKFYRVFLKVIDKQKV